MVLCRNKECGIDQSNWRGTSIINPFCFVALEWMFDFSKLVEFDSLYKCKHMGSEQ